MSEARSTHELWPSAEYLTAAAALEEALRPQFLEELTSTLCFYLGYCSGRRGAGRLTDEDAALLRELTDVGHDYAELAGSWQAHLERRRATMRELLNVPEEWHVLLDRTYPEHLLAAWAERYGARTTLASIVHKRRWDERREVFERELHEMATASGRSSAEAARELIAQAAHVAAIEARRPHSSVTVTVLGSRRQYRRGRDGDDLMPIRDLPLQLVWRWVRQQMRRYVLEQIDPSGRDAEALADAPAPMVLVRIDPDAPIDRSGDRRGAVHDIAAPSEAAGTADPLQRRVLRDLWAQLDENDRAIAYWQSARVEHDKIAAELDMSPAAVRQRWSRLTKRAKALLAAARTSHPPGTG